MPARPAGDGLGTGEGLPIGSQFIGRYADEATLFRIAAQIEAARPWAQRWPAI